MWELFKLIIKIGIIGLIIFFAFHFLIAILMFFGVIALIGAFLKEAEIGPTPGREYCKRCQTFHYSHERCY